VTLASYYLSINRLMSQKKVVINIEVPCCSHLYRQPPPSKTHISWPPPASFYTTIIIFYSFLHCNTNFTQQIRSYIDNINVKRNKHTQRSSQEFNWWQWSRGQGVYSILNHINKVYTFTMWIRCNKDNRYRNK